MAVEQCPQAQGESTPRLQRSNGPLTSTNTWDPGVRSPGWSDNAVPVCGVLIRGRGFVAGQSRAQNGTTKILYAKHFSKGVIVTTLAPLQVRPSIVPKEIRVNSGKRTIIVPSSNSFAIIPVAKESYWQFGGGREHTRTPSSRGESSTRS